jgi:hypothetical protein
MGINSEEYIRANRNLLDKSQQRYKNFHELSKNKLIRFLILNLHQS